jgi:hypothetical protein
VPLRSVEAATRDDAIAAAREQFGPSARVVGVRRVRSGGVLGFFATERYVAEVAEHPDAPGLPVPAPARSSSSASASGTSGAGKVASSGKPSMSRTAAPADLPATLRGAAPSRNGAAAYAAEARTTTPSTARTGTGDQPRWRTDEERLREIAGLLAAAAEEPVPNEAAPTPAGYQKASFPKAAQAGVPQATRLSGALLAASGISSDDDDDEAATPASPATPSPFTAALARMVAGDREVRQAVEDALDQPAVRKALRETGRRPTGPAPIRKADTSVWSKTAHQEEDPVALQDYTPPTPSVTAPVEYPTWAAEPEPVRTSSREEAIAEVLRSALAQGHSDEALAGILRKVLDDTAPPAGASAPAPVAEAPAFAAPAFAAPAFETPAFETPAFESPAFVSQPFEAASFEAPSFEAPSFEAPSFEAPSFEAPSFEAPSFEAPSFEAPHYEPAPVEAPTFEAPAFETAAIESAVVETPVIETVVVGTPVIETPIPVIETPIPVVETATTEPAIVAATAAPADTAEPVAEHATTAEVAPVTAGPAPQVGSFDLFGPTPTAAASEPVVPVSQEPLWAETVVPARRIETPSVDVPAEAVAEEPVARAAADEAAPGDATPEEVVSELAEVTAEGADVLEEQDEAAQPEIAAPLLARTASDPAPLSLDATTVMPPLSLLPPLPSSRHRGRPPVPPASRPPVPPSRSSAAAPKAPAPDAATPSPAGLLATVTRLPVAPLSEHFDAIAAAVEASPDLPTVAPRDEVVPGRPADPQSPEATTEDLHGAPAPQPTAHPAPAAAPRTPEAVLAGLRALGVPERLLGSSFADDVAQQGAYAALTRALALRLPPAPVAPDGAGEVLFVVGPGVEALRAARALALSLRLDPDRVQWATRGDLAGLAPKASRMTTVEAAVDRRQDAASASTVTIVAVDAPLRSDAYWMSQMLAIWEPVAVWAVVEATRKPEDLEPWVAGLPRLDAIMVQDTDLSADPAAVLARVEAPVALVDGVRATPHRWASLLCERLETAQT